MNNIKNTTPKLIGYEQDMSESKSSQLNKDGSATLSFLYTLTHWINKRHLHYSKIILHQF